MNALLKGILQKAYKLGDHNDPLNAALAVALFKGINRPLFTMMDKKSDPQVKKYAAFREGLTEVIAASTYIATNKLLVGPLANMLHKKTGKSLGKITNGLELLCVCLSAVLLIPLVCNITLSPVMKGIAKLKGDFTPFKNKFHLTENKTFEKLDIKEPGADKPDPTIKMTPLPAVHGGITMPSGPNSLLMVLQRSYSNPSMKGGLRI